MITVICGEDVVASRALYESIKHDFRLKSSEIRSIMARDVVDIIDKSELNTSLFFAHIVYCVDNLSSVVSRLKSKHALEPYERIAQRSDVHILDWEDGKAARDISMKFASSIKECKPAHNIFQFLDTLYPGNITQAYMRYVQLSAHNDSMFLFTMMTRHIRSLLLAKNGQFLSRVQPWQKSKLSSQAKQWPAATLEAFYEGFGRVDIAMKTAGTPLSLEQSLAILLMHYV